MMEEDEEPFRKDEELNDKIICEENKPNKNFKRIIFIDLLFLLILNGLILIIYLSLSKKMEKAL